METPDKPIEITEVTLEVLISKKAAYANERVHVERLSRQGSFTLAEADKLLNEHFKSAFRNAADTLATLKANEAPPF